MHACEREVLMVMVMVMADSEPEPEAVNQESCAAQWCRVGGDVGGYGTLYPSFHIRLLETTSNE